MLFRSIPGGAKIGFAEAFRFWLKLGFISFGGPTGQIAIMHQELVERRRWISEARFLHALNYCMLLPGPEAQQLATYIGWLLHRGIGGIAAGALFVLPSLLILIALSWIYVRFGEVPLVAALFYGIKPAVIAIVAHAVWRVGSRTLKHPVLWLLALGSLLATALLQLPFPLVLLVSAWVGWLLRGRLSNASASGHASSDDHSPLPAHAQFRKARAAKLLLIGALLWGVPMTLLWWWFGPSNTLWQMGAFFSKAALMTFGGAYAVLPYVFQGAVETYHWLTPAQMMDGLALGESTPGPLIMVVTFIGFLGGHVQPVMAGEQGALWSALLGALVATWFTFLPSFLFILIGGHLVETTQGQWRWTAPLSAISAAVVGVMLHLALFFARQFHLNPELRQRLCLAHETGQHDVAALLQSSDEFIAVTVGLGAPIDVRAQVRCRREHVINMLAVRRQRWQGAVRAPSTCTSQVHRRPACGPAATRPPCRS